MDGWTNKIIWGGLGNLRLIQVNALLPAAKPLCKKMPYQSKNCVIHAHKFTDDYHNDDAFDFSHWDNEEDSIVYFIPTIEDENELTFL